LQLIVIHLQCKLETNGPFKNPKDGESRLKSPKDGERRKKTSKDVIFIKLQLEKSTITH